MPPHRKAEKRAAGAAILHQLSCYREYGDEETWILICVLYHTTHSSRCTWNTFFQKGILHIMNKTIIALSLVIALVAVGPVSAAGIDFGGSIETKIEVNKKAEDLTVVPASELSLNLGVNAAQDKIRAGVEFGLEDESAQLMPTGLSLGDITLKKAYIEADGPYWHGGPEATTRFGTLDIQYSPYASLKDRSGISISGVDLDVVGLNAFYGLPLGEELGQGHVLGLRSDLALVDEVDLGASVIADDELIRLQVDAAAEPMEGLKIEGAFAADKTEEEGLNNLWTVKAGYEVMEDTNVVAGYKFISEDWVPRYVAAKTKDEDAEHDWIHLARAKDHGLFVGVETAQQGVNIHADYDQMFAEASVGADTEYEGFKFNAKTVLDVPALGEIATKSATFGVGRDIEVMDGLAVAANYKGEWKPSEKITHTLGASTTIGSIVPAVDGLKLKAEVSASELNLDSVGYKVGAEFEAPNGVNLGIEHARSTGTTFTAGMKVDF